jgi:UDP-N-acetyl-2-amino-2-deoxyglucuronate dehydrogenase
MTQNPIGVGILGCGFIARAHMRGYMAFPTETRIVALYNRTRAKAEAARAYIQSYAVDQSTKLSDRLLNPNPADDLVELQDRREALLELANSDIAIYDQWQDLAADDRIGLVTNTTPPYLHHASTRDMLEAGKHVLLEKPLSGSLAEADELIATAEASNLCFSVVSQGRYADDQRRMRALVANDKLGRIFLVKCDTHWYRDNSYYTLEWRGNWANECGGALLNHGWHLLDQSLFIVGKRVKRVSARMNAFTHTPLREKALHGVPTEDTIVAVLEFEDGALGEVTAAVTLHTQRAQIEVYGEQAATQLIPFAVESQDADYTAELRAWAAQAIEPQPADWLPPQAERDTIDGVRQYRDPTWTHTAQVRDVIHAIHEGRPTLSDGRDAWATLEVVLAAYKSAITGQPVELPMTVDDPYYQGVDAALRSQT